MVSYFGKDVGMIVEDIGEKELPQSVLPDDNI